MIEKDIAILPYWTVWWKMEEQTEYPQEKWQELWVSRSTEGPVSNPWLELDECLLDCSLYATHGNPV